MTDNEKFELKARLFYQRTGVMAPGKNTPKPMSPALKHRDEMWSRWIETNGQCIDDTIKAYENIMGMPYE